MSKIIIVTLFVVTFCNAACGQDHQKAAQWVTNFKNIEENTVVLNNDKEVIPFINLEEKKIATIDLGF